MALSLPWPRVQSLIGELRFCKPCGMAKKERKKERKNSLLSGLPACSPFPSRPVFYPGASVITPQRNEIISVPYINKVNAPQLPGLHSIAALAFGHHHLISPTTSLPVAWTPGLNDTKESWTPNTLESFAVSFPPPGTLFRPFIDSQASHPSGPSSSLCQQSKLTDS